VKRGLAVAILLPVVVAGCGGGSSKGGLASHSPNASATSSKPSIPKAAASAAATQALLTISDFPTGWSTSKDDSDSNDSSDKKFDKQLADCLHAPVGLLDSGGTDSVDADSPDFDSPDGNTTISESISIADSSRVNQLFSVLHQDNAVSCVSTTVNAYVKEELAKSDDPDVKQAKFGDVEVGQLSTGHYGDDTVGMRANLPIQVQGLTLHVYLDLLFVRHANTAAFLTFESEGTPVASADTDKYAQLATDKLSRISLPTA
jgi:hypothetical protein